MITSPTIDIIVPVWNNLFDTRACLVAILAHSSGARLIIVDNGSSRETELMLEEFSESLGERGLFIKSEKNIGLVAAVNIGLARSDSDYAVVVRPTVTVHAKWLETLVDAAQTTGAGLVSPLFSGDGAPLLPQLSPGISIMESCTISFETLLIRAEMRMVAGTFQEHLDGGEWCLREYVRRVAAHGYRTCIAGHSRLTCSTAQVFGSVQRRAEMEQSSQSAYLATWGISRHYCLYLGADTDAGNLCDFVATILDGARQGHRFLLILHRRQYSAFRKMGWNGLHTGIELHPLSVLFPLRSFQRIITALKNKNPDLIAVRGCCGAVFPGTDTALPFDEVQNCIAAHTTTVTAHPREACT
ncbi:MAG: glycosyltransferase family 2 protein [Desulfuromonadaceae bacterium]|nr:glycosyltransferase family 2 protein [Desulfuromonadaceae bacterium]MDD5104599.1 glycosyltransferase family 2 protein [Desulfuromonadaceae bacterium]